MIQVITQPSQLLFTHRCFVLPLDPFGVDPFKESDPFKGTSSEEFFKKSDMFGSSDPFSKKPTPPAKVSNMSSFQLSDFVCYKCQLWFICKQYDWENASSLYPKVQNVFKRRAVVVSHDRNKF